MLPLVCEYAVTNARDIALTQNTIENNLWITELNFFNGVASIRVEMNSFYSELRIVINSRLKLEIQEKVNFFSENEELLLDRVKRLHILVAGFRSNFKDFEVVTKHRLKQL